METIVAKVSSVRFVSFTSAESGNTMYRYRVFFDTQFTALIEKDNDYIESMVDYIDFVPKYLIAQCCDKIDGFSLFYTKRKENAARHLNGNDFGAAELHAILNGATISFNRIKRLKDSEYTDINGNVCILQHDKYDTDILSIEVSNKIKVIFDRMIDKLLEI